MIMDLKREALKLHEQLKGKTELKPKIAVDQRVLSLLYTPGVAEVVRRISDKKEEVYRYTGRGNAVAIVSDGSRVLGLGNRGPEAALPVMEGKALLYKVYGNVDAVPLCIKTQDVDEIIQFVENIEPTFGAINIEDIEVPKCFEVVDELTKRLKIPVFHDDQHGTAIVATAALLNALQVVGKKLQTARIVILGAGAAGYGIAHLLYSAGARDMLVLDSKGILSRKRKDLHIYKQRLIALTNPHDEDGTLDDAVQDADVFIGVSGQADILTPAMIGTMHEPVVFALSNPDPEILPSLAFRAGAKIVATGRSDFPNQVNNAIVFPFLMRKILDERISHVGGELMLSVARQIARMTKPLTAEHIIPTVSEMRPL